MVKHLIITSEKFCKCQVISLEVHSVFNRWLMYQCYLSKIFLKISKKVHLLPKIYFERCSAVTFSKFKGTLLQLFKRTCRHKNRVFKILLVTTKVVCFTGSIWYPRVFVCTYYQDVKLILDPLNLEYKHLLKFLVCNPGNKHCMTHWCPNCPDDEEQLYLYLKEIIESLNIPVGTIKFCQWTTTFRANLVNFFENIETYIENGI